MSRSSSTKPLVKLPQTQVYVDSDIHITGLMIKNMVTDAAAASALGVVSIWNLCYTILGVTDKVYLPVIIIGLLVSTIVGLNVKKECALIVRDLVSIKR